jgi:hypothetical protein
MIWQSDQISELAGYYSLRIDNVYRSDELVAQHMTDASDGKPAHQPLVHGATPIPRSIRRVEPTLPPGSSFMFIIGHVGAGVAPPSSSKQQTTYIGASINPGEALRQFNNTQRGARPATICVCIYVPGWRRLAVNELVQLWHRSRKLACRMRFGITMAHDLGLPCFVTPAALVGDAARRALPHIVERYEAQQRAATSSELAEQSEVPKKRNTRRSSSTSSRSGGGGGVGSRSRRAKRPSKYEKAVTEHVLFGDLSADAVMQTVMTYAVGVQPPSTPLDESALDQINTMRYNNVRICFTIGKHGNVSRRVVEPAATTKRRSAVVQPKVRSNEDEEEDDDSGAEDEEEEEDDDDASEIVERTPVRSSARAKRKRPDIADDDVALAPLRLRNQQEMAAYQRESSLTPPLQTSSTEIGRAQPTAPAVSAAERIAQECLVNGTIDNRVLVERADDCFTDANEYIARPLKRVHIERAQHCVCGALDSFVGGVCGQCRRTTASVRVVRTNVAALRESATKQPCSSVDRREISRLLASAERETPLDAYTRTTTEQLREALAQQQQAVVRPRVDEPTSPRRMRVPKEMRFISAVLTSASGAK